MRLPPVTIRSQSLPLRGRWHGAAVTDEGKYRDAYIDKEGLLQVFAAALRLSKNRVIANQ